MNTQVMHTTLYVTHANEELILKLVKALNGVTLDREKAYAFATAFKPDSANLVDDLFRPRYTRSFIFENNSDEEHGYHLLHLDQDEWGDTSMVHFIEFLYALVPGIHAQAWGYSEEDPSEFFIKYDNGRVIKQEHIPWEDEHMDDNAIEYIYSWWHEDMPDEIEAGLLSVGDEIDDDEDE